MMHIATKLQDIILVVIRAKALHVFCFVFAPDINVGVIETSNCEVVTSDRWRGNRNLYLFGCLVV